MNNKISYLCLDKFRNYDFFEINIDRDIIAISGDNGIGKTNILEAITLLLPSSNFRNCKIKEMDNLNFLLPWSISANIKNPYGIQNIQVTRLSNKNNDTKIYQINGKKITQKKEINKLISFLWVTPQMDFLFLDSRSERLKFFDQLINILDSEHYNILDEYEKILKDRLKILKSEEQDVIWLNSLEKRLSELSVIIAFSRVEKLSIMQKMIDDLGNNFPKADLLIEGEIEERILKTPSISLEGEIREKLLKAREIDRISGRSNYGIHKANFNAIYKKNMMQAKYCSTGEQKLLVLSIIIAAANSRKDKMGSAPILLLDEIISHLDSYHQNAFFEEISNLETQSFLTGVNLNLKQIAENKYQNIIL